MGRHWGMLNALETYERQFSVGRFSKIACDAVVLARGGREVGQKSTAVCRFEYGFGLLIKRAPRIAKRRAVRRPARPGDLPAGEG